MFNETVPRIHRNLPLRSDMVDKAAVAGAKLQDAIRRGDQPREVKPAKRLPHHIAPPIFRETGLKVLLTHFTASQSTGRQSCEVRRGALAYC